MKTVRRDRMWVGLAIAGATLAVSAPAAAETTVQKSGSELVVRGGPEYNRLIIGRPFNDDPNVISVWQQTDYGPPVTSGALTAGPGCEQSSLIPPIAASTASNG